MPSELLAGAPGWKGAAPFHACAACGTAHYRGSRIIVVVPRGRDKNDPLDPPNDNDRNCRHSRFAGGR